MANTQMDKAKEHASGTPEAEKRGQRGLSITPTSLYPDDSAPQAAVVGSPEGSSITLSPWILLNSRGGSGI